MENAIKVLADLIAQATSSKPVGINLLTGPDRNRLIDREIKHIETKKLSGCFNLSGGINPPITAYFENGLLHRDDGEAWSEYYKYDGWKRAWARNGVILAEDDEGYRREIVPQTGEYERVAQINLARWGIHERPLTADMVRVQPISLNLR